MDVLNGCFEWMFLGLQKQDTWEKGWIWAIRRPHTNQSDNKNETPKEQLWNQDKEIKLHQKNTLKKRKNFSNTQHPLSNHFQSAGPSRQPGVGRRLTRATGPGTVGLTPRASTDHSDEFLGSKSRFFRILWDWILENSSNFRDENDVEFYWLTHIFHSWEHSAFVQVDWCWSSPVLQFWRDRLLWKSWQKNICGPTPQ